MTPTGVALGGWAAAAAVFALLWLRQRRTRNATSVDAAWAGTIGVLALAGALVLDGPPLRRALAGGLGALWAFRLMLHLLTDRVLRETDEDGRYRALRAKWGDRADSRFFLFYQAQALVAAVFALPILASMHGGPPGPADGAAALLWLIAVGGESLADRQLARFRADPATRGLVCTTGFWRYSRHPNYFFEWLHWFVYVIIGRGAPLTWIGPVLMLLFLYRISGIPYAEAQSLASRGEAYRAYQRSTSAFFPWFPRKESA